MTPHDFLPTWQTVAALLQIGGLVVLVYFLYLASATIALVTGVFVLCPLCQAVCQIVASTVRVARPVVGNPSLPPAQRLLADIDAEYVRAERQIDAIAHAFDRQVERLIAQRRSPDDARHQRQDPARPVHR